ncbi:MAG: hypothetical protein JRN67_07215 [Nitrososphaerota archaeon]|nr:hypothetical protein [Nitrososphaerota archaeon]
MNASRAMAVMVVVIVIIGIFLLAPIINYTFTGSNFGVGSYEVTAQVSPSFYFVGCGIVYNPTQTSTIAGYTHTNLIWSGGEWRCKSS